MHALVYAALTTALTTGTTALADSQCDELHIIAGLPLGLAGGDDGRERVAAVKSWLMGNHRKWPF